MGFNWPSMHCRGPFYVQMQLALMAHACTTRGEAGMEVAVWESHVLANVPFYTVLLPLFLDLLRRRVSSRGDAALTDLVKVGVLPLHGTGQHLSSPSC